VKRILTIESRKSDEDKPLSVEHEILKFSLLKGSVERLIDVVATEDWVELYINGEHYAEFSCSPSKIKELVLGHLLTEGMIKKLEEVKSLDISNGKVYVLLRRKSKPGFSKVRRILTECGGKPFKLPPHLWMGIGRVKGTSTFKLPLQTIIEASKILNSQAHIFKITGGTHASALLGEDGSVIAFAEDVGRHNAVDKVVGEAAMKDAAFERSILATTGRLTSEIVVKAANVGIPIIVSLSAPTDKGVKIAETVGLTLIGFTRGKRFNVYTNPERIKTTGDTVQGEK